MIYNIIYKSELEESDIFLLVFNDLLAQKIIWQRIKNGIYLYQNFFATLR